LPQPLHHHLADPRRGQLAFAGGLHLALDAGDELIDPLLLDAALAAGERHRFLDLRPVERLASPLPVLAAALDHRDLAQLHALERREAAAAADALAAAADSGVVLRGPGVLH